MLNRPVRKLKTLEQPPHPHGRKKRERKTQNTAFREGYIKKTDI